jgi:hypothetical protein
VRFFWEYRPDLIPKKDLLAAYDLLLDQKDIADIAIEDLRKWKQWGKADRILALYGKDSHNIPIVRRAILRYALSCQDEVPAAKAFVEEQRKLDPKRVKDAEELLKWDDPKPAPAR